MKKQLVVLGLLLCLFLSCSTDSATNNEDSPPSIPANNGFLKLPEKFISTIVADSIGPQARHIAVNENGDIYVNMRRITDGFGLIALRDTNNDGQADVKEGFTSYAGTGIGIYNGYLYAASWTEVFRYALDGKNLIPVDTTGEIIVSGFPEQYEHDAKALAFDGQGHLFVNVGAPSNACMINHRTAGSAGHDPCPQREWQASIWRFDANKAGQTQQDDGHQYVRGTRNCVALDWDKASNSLYGVQHGRDQLHMFWEDMFDDEQNAELPSEEFFRMADGDDFGWPYCYYDHIQDKKVLAPEYGGDSKTSGRCDNMKKPIFTFPGHLAPNDLLFYTGDQFPEKYKNGAFVAFHGSWNRTPLPQKGFFVAFVPFKDGNPAGDWEIFAEGFAELDQIKSPGDAKHRPMGLAQGPDGSLYVVDSVVGKIWKVSYAS